MAERSRTLVFGSIVGAVVILVAIVAIIVASLNRGADPSPTGSGTPTATSPSRSAQPTPDPSGTTPGTGPSSPFDPEAEGWVVEPITTDPEKYVLAALEAVLTFDTRNTSREEFLAYLNTWMTPALSEQTTEDNKRVLANQVLLSEGEWATLTELQGTSTPELVGEVSPLIGPDDGSYKTTDATFEVSLRPGDRADETSGWAQTRTIGVMVQCTDESVPAPGTDQKPGDCKVVRWSVND